MLESKLFFLRGKFDESKNISFEFSISLFLEQQKHFEFKGKEPIIIYLFFLCNEIFILN